MNQHFFQRYAPHWKVTLRADLNSVEVMELQNAGHLPMYVVEDGDPQTALRLARQVLTTHGLDPDETPAQVLLVKYAVAKDRWGLWVNWMHYTFK